MPERMPLSRDYLDPSAAYLLDNGRILVLWLGLNLSPDFMHQVRHVQYSVSQVCMYCNV